MNRIAVSAFASGLALLAASQASAAPPRHGLVMLAEVDTFCRLSIAETTLDDDGRIAAVRETCNTAGGYAVNVAFSNLASGTVHADIESVSIGADGQAVFTSDMARRRTRLWSVENGVRANPGEPVTVRFSITPL